MTSCNGVSSLYGGGCTWNRKFKVSCSLEDGDVYVRVQTNSLPDHCYLETSGVNIIENFVDFKVKFDSDPATLTKKEFTSATSANSALCKNGW